MSIHLKKSERRVRNFFFFFNGKKGKKLESKDVSSRQKSSTATSNLALSHQTGVGLKRSNSVKCMKMKYV